MNEKEHFEKYVSILETRNKQLKEENYILQKEIENHRNTNSVFLAYSVTLFFIGISLIIFSNMGKRLK